MRVSQDIDWMDAKLREYINQFVNEPSPVFKGLREDIAENHVSLDGQPSMQISQHQGAVLAWLGSLMQAQRYLEVGTFIGYSTMWMAWAMGSNGSITTIERFPHRAEAAEKWYAHSGYECAIDQRVGQALEVLVSLPSDAYDMALIDCDKAHYPEMLEECIRCVRPGGLVVADNAFFMGRIFEANLSEAATGILEFNRMAMSHPKLHSIVLPVGDGFMASRVLP